MFIPKVLLTGCNYLFYQFSFCWFKFPDNILLEQHGMPNPKTHAAVCEMTRISKRRNYFYTSHIQSSLVMAGLGLAAVGFAGRYAVRQLPNVTKTVSEAFNALPKFDAESLATSKYYKGGFDAKMNKREASLILGVSPSASKTKVLLLHIVRISFEHNFSFRICVFFYVSDQGRSQTNNVDKSSGSRRFSVFGGQNQRGQGSDGQCAVTLDWV